MKFINFDAGRDGEFCLIGIKIVDKKWTQKRKVVKALKDLFEDGKIFLKVKKEGSESIDMKQAPFFVRIRIPKVEMGDFENAGFSRSYLGSFLDELEHIAKKLTKIDENLNLKNLKAVVREAVNKLLKDLIEDFNRKFGA